MNVLHLNSYGSFSGGVESYIAEVSAALAARGHTSHLVYFASGDPGDLIPSTTCVSVPDGRELATEVVQALEQVVESTRPDVAYVHAVYQPDLVEWVSQRLPTVAYVHGPYLVCPGSAQFLRQSERVCPYRPGWACLWNAQVEHCCWGRNPILHLRKLRRVNRFRQVYAQIGRILVGGSFMRDLLARVGLVRNVSILAPMLIAERPVDIVAPQQDQVLYAGRLVQEKGPRHLLHALARIKADWRLVVAGDGPSKHDYQSLASRLDIAERVEFLGWLSPDRMQSVLQASAIVVIPSLWPEPYGRVGPEAFTFGRPVVAFASGGVVDWLDHESTGLLVPPGDVDELARALERLLQEPGLREQMGQRAREVALRRWRPDEHINQLVDHFASAR
jgi:glycosyltransferase involved in cell wall biosynthesis